MKEEYFLVSTITKKPLQGVRSFRNKEIADKALKQFIHSLNTFDIKIMVSVK